MSQRCRQDASGDAQLGAPEHTTGWTSPPRLREDGTVPDLSDLGVVIVNYRTAELTLAAVASLLPARAAFASLRVVVVDGASGDGSAERIAAGVAAACWSDWVSVLPLDVNGGFAFANNRAIAVLAAAGSLPAAIALVNPDARVRPGALEAMAALLAREPRAGAVGALLIHDDERPQSSAFHFPSIAGEFCRGAQTGAIDRLLRVPPTRIDSNVAIEVPWVTGAAVMLRTAALAQAGLFDEGFFLYFEETELMRRLRRHGWTVWHEPAARVVHEGGAATQIRDPATGLPRRQPLPAYWYAARRRYFALAHGRSRALGAGLAWLAGRGVWRLRQLVAPRPHMGAEREGRDLVAHGLWPHRGDAAGAPRALGAPAGDRPAWMTR